MHNGVNVVRFYGVEGLYVHYVGNLTILPFNIILLFNIKIKK